MLSHLKLLKGCATQRAPVGAIEPRSLQLGDGRDGVAVSYSDGEVSAATCLRCPDAPCMRYDATELLVSGFPTFPSDGGTDVCASAAISWAMDADVGPTIDGAKCFGCGLCVARCPVGAIHLDKDMIATVVDSDTKHLCVQVGASALSTRAKFVVVPRMGAIAIESDAVVNDVAGRMAMLQGESGPRFPNLLARNLMLGVGWSATMRRSGDTNMRIDLIAQRMATICAVEVEFSDAVIDAPRSVLDSLSVLLARYEMSRDTLVGMVFAGSIPNRRSEYWQVISDIEKVLSARVHMVTPLALMLLVWAGKSLKVLPFGDQGNTTIRDEIEASIGRRLAVSLGAAAALETAK